MLIDVESVDQSASLKFCSSPLSDISYRLPVPHFPLNVSLTFSDSLLSGSWAGGFGWTLSYWTIDLWVFLYKLWCFWFKKGCGNRSLCPLFPPCLLSMLERKRSFFVASLFTSEKRFRRNSSCPDSAAVSPANFVTLLIPSAHQGHPGEAGDNSPCLPRGLMHLCSLKHAKCFEILGWKLLARVNG